MEMQRGPCLCFSVSVLTLLTLPSAPQTTHTRVEEREHKIHDRADGAPIGHMQLRSKDLFFRFLSWPHLLPLRLSLLLDFAASWTDFWKGQYELSIHSGRLISRFGKLPIQILRSSDLASGSNRKHHDCMNSPSCFVLVVHPFNASNL